jgi:hypothetical protein
MEIASKIPVAEGVPPKAGEPTGLVPRGGGKLDMGRRAFFNWKRFTRNCMESLQAARPLPLERIWPENCCMPVHRGY